MVTKTFKINDVLFSYVENIPWYVLCIATGRGVVYNVYFLKKTTIMIKILY